MEEYKIISGSMAIQFLKHNKAHKEQVAISSADVWIGVVKNHELMGVCGVDVTQKTARIKGFYVLKKHRGLGLGTKLIDHVIHRHPGTSKIFRAKPKATLFATQHSKNIFIKFGFKPVKMRGNNITFMERTNE